MGNKQGRPSKYSAEIQKQADEYVKGGYEMVGDAIPSILGMAYRLGVCRQTLHNWAAANEDFLYTFVPCSDQRHLLALNKELSGEFNPLIARLILSNHA